jgi:hypothetical protein
MVYGGTGPRENAERSAGVLEYWSIGVLEYWSTGVLEYWSTGVLEYWSTGVLGVAASIERALF